MRDARHRSPTMASLMVDRDIGEMFPVQHRCRLGRPAFSRSGGSARHGAYARTSILHAAREGEILGLTGLDRVRRQGAGLPDRVRPHRRPITAASCCAGRRPPSRRPRGRCAQRLGLVPEDRRGQGVALDISVRENATLASLRGLTRFGLIDTRRERRQVEGLIDRLGIKTAGPGSAGAGPQRRQSAEGRAGEVAQRAVTDIYMLDEPTVAIDVAGKVEIYRLLG